MGIAHLNKQNRLQNEVNTQSDKYFDYEGHIKGLHFILKIQDKKISVLNNVTERYLLLMNNITQTLSMTTQRINDNQVIDQHTMTWISDALSIGGIYNQMLNMYNVILRTRVKAIGDLAHVRLPPEVITSQELYVTLTKLQAKLKEKYVGLQVTKFNIWDYYTMNNINSFVRNGTICISIPVNLEMFDHTYQLYEINTFMVPVESKTPQATIIMDYIDLLVVNEEQNNYFVVTREFLNFYYSLHTFEIKPYTKYQSQWENLLLITYLS